MLQVDPAMRLTIEQVVRHSAFVELREFIAGGRRE